METDQTLHAHEGAAIPRGMWTIVPDQSRVAFKVRKMGLYYVKGRFRDLAGRVDFDLDEQAAGGELTINAASISTRMPPRDWHLRTTDFLDVARHPLIRVRVEGIEPHPTGELAVAASFELHGQRRPVELFAHAHATPGPPEAVLLHVRGTLDRHDFGIRPRLPFEWVVGREVLLDAELQLARAE
jgi:polyisoprenoid-binding protein YceI